MDTKEGRKWGEKLPQERYRHSMITINNFIYVAGGTNDRKTSLDSFLKIDIYNRHWEELENMLNKRESFFMTNYKSKYILVAGGFNGMK